MFALGKEREYIVHDEKNVKGFFGEYRYMSNFEVCDVYFDGGLYGSSEAAYMAGKTLNPKIRAEFFKSTGITPAEARKLGRRDPNILELRPDWDEVKYDHMSAVVFDKFCRNINLREKLIVTGDKYLEETNHWGDVYWGVFWGEKNGKVYEGVGESHLGNILMGVRDFWKRKKEDKITKLF